MASKNDEGYDPEWLALEAAFGGRHVLTGDIAVDRKAFDETGAALAKMWPKLEEDLTITNCDIPGTSMKARWYRPTALSEPLPMMIYFHGGGWVSGSLDTEDPQCRIFAAKTPCVVISIDYPLAPEATMDEIIAATRKSVDWAIEAAEEYRGDPSKIVLAGGSAGGSSVFQTVFNMITTGAPHLSSVKGILSIFGFAAPFDYSGPFSELFLAHRENGEGVPLLSHDVLVNMWNTLRADLRSAEHVPLLAGDEILSKFPPTYLMAAAKDPFRDDSMVLEKRLAQLGVPVRLNYLPGYPHYAHWYPQLKRAHEAMADLVEGAKWLLANVH